MSTPNGRSTAWLVTAYILTHFIPPLESPAQSSWTNAQGGNWSTAGNWVPATLPGTGTNVFFTNNVAVTYPTYVVTNDVLNNTMGNLTIYNFSSWYATLYSAMNGFNPAGNMVIGYGGNVIITNSTATVGGSLIISNVGTMQVLDGANVTVNGNLDSSYGLWVYGSNAVLSVLGSGISRAANFHPYVPWDLSLIDGGTLNFGGTSAAAANNSSVTFTNAGSLTFNGYNHNLYAGTINASTNTVGVYNTGTIQTYYGNGTINATFVNETNGLIAPDPYGHSITFERFPTNRGKIYLWNYYSGVAVNQGDFVNQGSIYTEYNTLSVLGGRFINDTNGVMATGLYGGTLNAQSLLNLGKIAITSSYVGPINFACVVTNQGLITLYRSDAIDFGRSVYAAISASNIVNSGTLMALGQTNVFTHLSHPTFMNEISTPVTNLVGGVITATNGALMGFYPTVLPKNYGTIIVNPDSAVGMGAYDAAGYYDDKILYVGFSDFRNDGTIDLRGGTFGAGSVSNAVGAILEGWGDVGFAIYSNIVSTSGLTTNYARQFAVKPVHNSGLVLVNGTLNAGAVNNYAGGLITGSGVIASSNSTDYFVGETLTTSNGNTGARVVNYTGGLVLADGTTLTLANGLANQGGTATVTNGGVLNLGTGASTNSGLFNMVGGTISGGSFVNNSNILFTGSPSTLSAGGVTVANSGRVQVFGTTGTISAPVTSSGTFDLNNGKLIIDGSLQVLSPGAVPLTNATGLLQVGALGDGSISNAGVMTFNNGGTVIAGVLTNRGTIQAVDATGVIDARLVNNGTFLLSGPTASLALLDGGINLGGAFTIRSNANLNIGGVTPTAANASFVAFTNGPGATIFLPSQSGVATINASTTTVGFVNQGNFYVGNGITGTGIVNATMVNDTGGYLLVGPSIPSTMIVDSLTTNKGTVFVYNYYQNLIVNRGDVVNQGLFQIDPNTVTLNGGAFINDTGGSLDLQAAGSALNASSVLNKGVIAVTNATYGGASVATVITNQGTIKLFRAPAVQSDSYGVLVASNIVNTGTIIALSKTNTWTYRDSDYAINWLYASSIYSNVIHNLPGGVVTATNGGIMGIGLYTYASSPLENYGTVLVQSNSTIGVGAYAPIFGGTMLQLGLVNFRNDGVLALNGGAFGANMITNAAGGTIQGQGEIGYVTYSNLYSGSLLTTNYVRSLLARPIANSGLIAPDGEFNAGAITNLAGGRIIGKGTILSYDDVNSYSGETLIAGRNYTGARLVNNAGASILASGGLLVVSNGLANDVNSGTIGATNNGTLQFGDGTGVMTNNGFVRLLGGSSFISDKLFNNGSVQFEGAGNVLRLSSSLNIANGGSMTASNADGVVMGVVTNQGIIQIVNSTITFSNKMVGAGRYISDPSTSSFFDDVTILPSGTLEGGYGDVFDFKKNLFINSTNTGLFDLLLSTVSFTGGGDHTNAITGLDFDHNPTYGEQHGLSATNFAYGTLLLGPTDNLYLIDGDGNALNTNGLYLSLLDIGGSTNDLVRLHTPFNIYYRNGLAGNDYLGGLTYALDGGGYLIAIPEPTAALLVLGAFAILLRRRPR